MLRFFVPLLLATLLLLPTAASAQTPPSTRNTAAEPDANDLHWHRVILRYAAPLDVLKLMHWQNEMADMNLFNARKTVSPFVDKQGQGRSAQLIYARLPDGVNRIFALQSNNSLLLEATEAGYQRVQEIVKTLDIAAQQVRMTVRFVAVPLSQKQTFDLSNPNQALLQMYNANSLFAKPLCVTTDNRKPADFALPWLFLNPPTQAGNYLERLPTVRLTPCINQDRSVTLILKDVGTTTQVLAVLHTVSSGATTVYDATSWLPPSEYRVFLFVTPTVLSADVNDGAMKTKP